ncbi:MAG: phosphatidylserine decarboxylase family protein [Bacteroidales bacterium]
MMKIHKEGRWIVGAGTLLLAGLLVLSSRYLGNWANAILQAGSLILLVLLLRFFRVPARRGFRDERTLVAPADGKVVVVERVEETEYIQGPCMQVSIFMSIHNVHINYVPIGGIVEHRVYHPGAYLLAKHPKSSELNERWSTGIRTPFGPVLVRQIAGYVARRIRCYVKDGEHVAQGRELGFIKFGSRVDVFLPLDAAVLVKPGQKVMGNVTPIARWKHATLK